MNIRKFWRIAASFISMSFMDQMSHRKSFLFAMASKMLRSAILLIFFQAIYLKVDHIGTWSYNDVLVLLAVFLTFESLVSITFHRNLAYYFPDYLRKGTFDGHLVKPIPLLPHVAFRVIDLMDAFSTLPVIVLWIYILSKGIIHPTPVDVALFFAACLIGLALLFSVSTIIAAISFWSLIPTGLGRLYEQLYRTGRYPTDSLGPMPGLLLTYIVPFATIGTIPASALRGVLHPLTIIPAAMVVLLFVVLARFLWKRGLARYSSASS